MKSEKAQKNWEKDPLFDTELFTTHVDEVYFQIHRRALDGLEPDKIEVSR